MARIGGLLLHPFMLAPRDRRRHALAQPDAARYPLHAAPRAAGNRST
jgi:hypothetical protein